MSLGDGTIADIRAPPNSPFLNDFPRLLVVELSEDRQTRMEAWRGPTTAEAMVGALADPIGHPIEFRLDGKIAR